MELSLSAKSIAVETSTPSRPGGSLERRRLVERSLETEFDDVLEPDVIRGLAAASVEWFEGATVQRFIPILAIRMARRQARAAVEERHPR